MNKTFQNILKIVVIPLFVLAMLSCSKESDDLNDLHKTIYVRHKNADMPAYIHGNASEKVFLIILHGGPGGNGLVYRVNTIRTEIEKNNAIVYFDQRGSGNSQGNYSEEDVSVDLMAEDVLALAKVIKAKYGEDSKLFLMGHSWGGTLGTAALLKSQKDFLGWIDVAGTHDPKGTYEEYKIVLKETANAQIALGNSIDYWQTILDLVQSVGPYSLDDLYRLNANCHKAEKKLADDMVINEAIADYDDDIPLENILTLQWNKSQISEILDVKNGLWEKVSFTNRLTEITIPSLVLWGKYDLVVPTVYAQEAFDNLGASDKELVIFDKSAHSPMFMEPRLFSDKVIEFINDHK